MFETGAAQRMREQRPRGKLSDKFIFGKPFVRIFAQEAQFFLEYFCFFNISI